VIRKPTQYVLVVIALLSIMVLSLKPAHAENPTLSEICSNMDCLNNFTVKTGYSFKLKQEGTGGFTDLKKSWYLSPGVGFNYLRNGFSAPPSLDINAIFKGGQLLSDKVAYIHDFVNSHPFTQGLMKYTTVGETFTPGWGNQTAYDMTWVGATFNF
jgi:hypothetical protein